MSWWAGRNVWKADIIMRLARLERQLSALTAQGARIMADLTQLTEAVARTEGVAQSAIVLIEGLAAEVRALVAAGTVDPAAVAALADRLAASAAALGDAVVANPVTPAEP